MRRLTEEKAIKTFVRHVVIYNHFVIFVDAKSYKLNKVDMLELRDEYELIFELKQALS